MTQKMLDVPWKDILDQYFQAFMALCFPVVAKAIDWSKGYEILDKELSAIAKDAQIGMRIVDKAIKVQLLSGSELCVVFHIEVQGSWQSSFPERMYIYNYRLFDLHHVPIISVAILVDDNPNWRPSFYQFDYWGCQLRFDFIIVKIIDFQEKYDELLQSKNPFAAVILAQLAAINTQKDSHNRYLFKLNLTRRLYEKGWKKKDIINLYTFIDWIMVLPRTLELKYTNEMTLFEKEKNMPYVTSAERFGIEKGLQQGMQQGMQQGEKQMFLRILQTKFGAIPSAFLTLIDQAEANQISQWVEAIFTASSLEDIFALS